MKFARIIDGTVQELVDLDPEILDLPPFEGPATPTRRLGPAELADLERRVGASRPWDLDTGNLVPVVDTAKPPASPTQLVEQTGWKISADKVEPIYEARTKPVATPTVKELSDRLATVERDLTDVKLAAPEPIKKP